MSNNLIEKINEGLEILDDAGKIAGHGILHKLPAAMYMLLSYPEPNPYL